MNRRLLYILIIAAMALGGTAPARAAVINLPSPSNPTLQAPIDTGDDGLTGSQVHFFDFSSTNIVEAAVDSVAFAPQQLPAVTNAISTPLIVENDFTAVPEPRLIGYLAFPCTLIVMAFTGRADRRRRRSRRALWQRQFGLGAAVG